jgi:hypothetical protein
VQTLPRITVREQWRAVLVDRVRNDREPRMLAAAADVLLRAGADIGDLVKARATEKPDPAIRRTALNLLADGEIDREFFRHRLTADDDPEAVTIVAAALLRSGVDPAEPRDVLIRRLRDGAAISHRAAAAAALSAEFAADPDARHALAVAARNDSATPVRRAAIGGLGRFLPDHPGDVQVLLECALLDLDAKVQRDAVRAVGRHPMSRPAVVEAMVQLLDAPSPMARGAAATALLEAPPDAVRPHRGRVRNLAGNDESRSIRAAAIRLLLRIAPDTPETLDLVDKLLRLEASPGVIAALQAGVRADRGHAQIIMSRLSRQSDDEVVAAFATAYASALGPGSELRDALLGHAADARARLRATALGLLGRWFAEDADVRRTLIDAVRDPGADVRRTAVLALCHIATEDDDVRALVTDWAANAPDDAVRGIAGQALSWLPGADPELLPDLGAKPPPSPSPSEDEDEGEGEDERTHLIKGILGSPPPPREAFFWM